MDAESQASTATLSCVSRASTDSSVPSSVTPTTIEQLCGGLEESMRLDFIMRKYAIRRGVTIYPFDENGKRLIFRARCNQRKQGTVERTCRFKKPSEFYAAKGKVRLGFACKNSGVAGGQLNLDLGVGGRV